MRLQHFGALMMCATVVSACEMPLTGRWVKLGSDDSLTVHLDKNSPIRLDQTTYQVWFRMTFRTSDEVSELGRTVRYKQALAQVSVNCAARTSKQLREVYLDLGGQKPLSLESSDVWEEPIPGTLGEYMIDKVCARFKRRPLPLKSSE